ncbi:MAG: UDP-N-acetylmuramoyl-tripeptide--D-alanyl-D-alanine ligase [Elusimicrobia bacterium]|nr:UDP-N-acetylmuramoyl-tripeptide--D-alanyl-D-alanine ligase [Elusimicrobiota bacterium]
MNLNLTLEHLAKITGGKIVNGNPKTPFKTFATDSRVLTAGQNFWALKGGKFDANDFLQDVINKGAAAVVAERAENLDFKNTAFVKVSNALAALQTVAGWHRREMNLKLAAITGSNGKSTTKQMLLSICKTAGQTRANMGNLNNQFGLPFSLLEITPDDKYGVFELGASKKGDIAEIAAPAAPDVGIITNISAAHLEFFKNLQTVYDTKTELAAALNPGGTLVYNLDDDMLKNLKNTYKGRAITFGFSDGADLKISDKENFEFIYKDEVFSFGLNFERHNKLNAAAACAGAIALGLFKDNLERGLKNYEPMPMRMQRVKHGGATFILDCYNANPASMENAITLLAKEKTKPLIAVLGDMKELGAHSAKYHAAAAEQLAENKIETVFLSGPEMAAAAEILRAKHPNINVKYSLYYKDWLADLKNALKNGGTCLVKASRSMNFENIFKEF